jgi:hypothetical protein
MDQYLLFRAQGLDKSQIVKIHEVAAEDVHVCNMRDDSGESHDAEQPETIATCMDYTIYVEQGGQMNHDEAHAHSY